MAGYHNRSRYQYETSPRKLEPEYIPIQKKYPKKSTARKANQHKQKSKRLLQNRYKAICYVLIFFAVLFAISYRNTLISEKYSQIKEMKSNLADIEKENEQLEVSIESKTNLSAIEKEAEEKLGMQKLDDDQTIYANLDKQDYIESSEDDVILEEDNQNIFQMILEKIQNLF